MDGDAALVLQGEGAGQLIDGHFQLALTSIMAAHLLTDDAHPAAATGEQRRVVAPAERAQFLQVGEVVLQEVQVIRVEHVRICVARHPVHVIRDFLQDQETAVCAEVQTEVSPDVDGAQFHRTRYDDFLTDQAVEHERVLDAGDVVGVIDDGDARALVPGVEGGVRTHGLVASDHILAQLEGLRAESPQVVLKRLVQRRQMVEQHQNLRKQQIT